MSAYKLTTVAVGTVMASLTPLVTGVAGWYLLRERLPVRFWQWTVLSVLAICAFVLVAGADVRGRLLGTVFAASSVVGAAGFILAGKAGRDIMGAATFLLRSNATALVAVAVFTTATGVDTSWPGARDLWLLLGLVLGGGTLGHFLFTWALKWLEPSLGAVLRLAHTIVAAALAWLFLGETLTAGQLLWGGVTLVAVGGAVLGTRAQPPSTLQSRAVGIPPGRRA